MNARQRAEARAGYLLLVPSFVGVGVFLLLPVLIVLALSFTRYNLLSAPQWAGLDNFVYLLGWERFRNSLWVCARLALGVVWRWLFDPASGALKAALGRRLEWLADVDLALPSVAFVPVWSSVGSNSLLLLAGLQQIRVSVYEAAKLDAAGPV